MKNDLQRKSYSSFLVFAIEEVQRFNARSKTSFAISKLVLQINGSNRNTTVHWKQCSVANYQYRIVHCQCELWNWSVPDNDLYYIAPYTTLHSVPPRLVLWLTHTCLTCHFQVWGSLQRSPTLRLKDIWNFVQIKQTDNQLEFTPLNLFIVLVESVESIRTKT